MVFPSRSWPPGSSELIYCPATLMPPVFESFILNFPPLNGKLHVDRSMSVLGSTLSPFPVPALCLALDQYNYLQSGRMSDFAAFESLCST